MADSDWTAAWRRTPLFPVAAAFLLASFAGEANEPARNAFVPKRPVTAEVVVPALGAASWERRDGAWAARVRVLRVEQVGREVDGPKRAWLRLRGEGEPPVERRVVVRGYFVRRPGYLNLHVSRPGDWGLEVKSRLLMTPLGNAPGAFLRTAAAVRQRLLLPLDRADGRGALLARALVFGDARRLPPEWRTGLRRAGLSHLLAVSGLHVGLLLGGLWWIMGAWSPRMAWTGAVAVLLVYGVLVGPRPSLLRAGMMALLVVLALMLERPPQALNALCAALISILLFDPAASEDLGFQLSFLATAGILVLAPRLLGCWFGHDRPSGTPSGPTAGSTSRAERRPGPVAVALAATVAAQLATIPVTAAEIGLLTPLSPFFNLIFVPLTAAALGFSLAWVALAAMCEVPLLTVGAGPVARLLERLLDLVSVPFGLLAELPPGAWLALPVSVGAAPALVLAVWLAAALSGRLRCCLALALVLVCTPEPPHDEPTLTMLDVGQGEAILLRSQDKGPVILVDGGGFRQGNFAEATLLQTLAAEGVLRVDLAVLSHGDADHCRGLLELSQYLRIDRLWAASVELRDGCGLALAERLGSRVRTVGQGDAERVGDWNLQVLHPPAGPRPGGNSASLVVRACLDHCRSSGKPPARNTLPPVVASAAADACVLLTGDLDVAGERELLDGAPRAGADLGSEILKVGHHGSRTSTGPALLRAVAPAVALVSAGRQNPYGHPAPEVVARIERRGTRVLRTDLHGRIEVRFRADGAGRRRPLVEVADWPRRRLVR